MSSLIPLASERPGDDPIFALDSEAQRRRAAGETIINASIGALLDNDGKLAIMPSVYEALRQVDPRQAAAYAPIAGDKPFLEAVLGDVFAESPMRDDAIAVATAGGSGAVHHAVANFIDHGQSLLTTNYFWGPYAIIAEHSRRRVQTFEMFDEAGRFNIAAFREELVGLVERQGRALVVLNFPCHNPTGYSLERAEWESVAGVLGEVAERAPVTLLLDLAYAQFGGPGSDEWVSVFEDLTGKLTLLVAWTASKSFAQYGLRVGSLIAVNKDPIERAQIKNALAFSCRGTWSNCNHLGLLAITELLTSPELVDKVDLERTEMKRLLDERVTVFNREVASLGLSTPRYEGGFFVVVFTPDALLTAARAREHGVFVVPMKGAVRVALCGTPVADLPRLLGILAQAMQG